MPDSSWSGMRRFDRSPAFLAVRTHGLDGVGVHGGCHDDHTCCGGVEHVEHPAHPRSKLVVPLMAIFLFSESNKPRSDAGALRGPAADAAGVRVLARDLPAEDRVPTSPQS